MSFEAEHRRRIEEASAMTAEMLPSRQDEVAQVRAEFRDGFLCGDRDLLARTDAEAELREKVHGRLAGLWMLMSCAQDSRDEALSVATAAEMKATIYDEFRRRAGNLNP